MRLSLLLSLALTALVEAHSVLVYPGTRGNNLITNDTFPYGMQWMYPCGGLGTSRNRTYWPTTGGAVSFQPGWFRGHLQAQLQINLGYGTDGPDGGPPNMSNIMLKPFMLLGPSNNPYPGTVCLPQVPLPVGANVKAGDKATIQVVELAQHGAALYSCVDIIFAEPGDPRIPIVNETNCFNSTHFGFAQIYTVTTKNPVLDIVASTTTSAASLLRNDWAGWLLLAIGGIWMTLW
ncbi:hypothetical protein M441DRAFT_42998 [Trichoderma asperellum CBS 433.97]|uniref:Copper acquisition factor BIM1-like domain-containing protein n=1 Tax=Trichoderma asperellum (strain ATCC 204424 / CBS 433.97 / NBRC 101777) TaxID=1042311 RepID=A0A2T3ZJ69_TRIA4|nr:hypothetical protein M441DRAFT_42998 [Trichoderma asperellum CBS 433.97]PTB44857.1 hypothetical protein M441DRAFT_42998 [Trichoderma asperellum CBS 433.97]